GTTALAKAEEAHHRTARSQEISNSVVTETADFRKDLSLDSLDRVELVMALEEEFAIEIPEEEADKLTCCADVAKYIALSGDKGKTTEDSL
ncbi:hypothetical protein AQUCO_00500367v1, partial [Aquilegia coerulea]